MLRFLLKGISAPRVHAASIVFGANRTTGRHFNINSMPNQRRGSRLNHLGFDFADSELGFQFAALEWAVKGKLKLESSGFFCTFNCNEKVLNIRVKPYCCLRRTFICVKALFYLRKCPQKGDLTVFNFTSRAHSAEG